MSFSGGGGSTSATNPTEADIAELESLESRLANYEENFFPLEKDSKAEAFDPSVEENHRRELRGRVNADVMQAEKELTPAIPNSLRQGTATSTIRDIAKTGTSAQATAFKDADLESQNKTIQDQLNVVRTGEGKGRTALRGLREQSRIASSEAINKLRNKQIRRDGNLRAATTLVNGAVNAYGGYQTNQRRKEIKNLFSGAEK